jgi:hypothetical protein
MLIPIIHRRSKSRYRFLFISLIVTFVLSMCLLINSDLMTAIGYKMVETLALLVVMIHILVLLLFLFSKTVVEVGNLHLLENGFEIKMYSGESNFYLKSIARFKLIVEGYKGQNPDKDSGKSNDGLGNFIVIQTMQKTVFYELLLNSQLEMIGLLEYFRNAEYPGITDIEYNIGTS